MNTRAVGLTTATLLLGLGLLLTVRGLAAEPVAEPTVRVAVAADNIAPYTIITQGAVKLGGELTVREARRRGAYPVNSVVGLMSVGLIAPGDILTGANAKPVEEVRFVQDMQLEVVSFQAAVDRVVGGKVRPGHVVNLYGTGRGEDGEPFTILIEPRLWVVGVSSGGRPVSSATPQPNIVTGELEYVGGERDIPSTLITVAVPPEEAVNIIHEVGSRHLNPYVTLAASITHEMPPTPRSRQPYEPLANPPVAIQTLMAPTPIPAIEDLGLGGMAGSD